MAVRYIHSAELLDLADHLAGRNQGPGKPRTIYLRRSISTAYYAVFHMLTQHTAVRLLGPGWTTKHATVARWVTHTDLAVLAEAANGRKNQELVAALARSILGLRTLHRTSSTCRMLGTVRTTTTSSPCRRRPRSHTSTPHAAPSSRPRRFMRVLKLVS